MKHITQALLCIAWCCTAFTSIKNEAVPPQESTRSLQIIAQGFKEVAKQATPAVVYIEVQQAAPETTQRRQPKGFFEHPFDHFHDDFFNRFFNFPYPEETPKPTDIRGSGFLIRPDGYIVTNNHVVDKGTRFMVTLNDGTRLPAKVVGTDPKTDLAVIKIQGNNFPYLSFGNSHTLEVGDWAIAVGTPFGLQASVTVGIVSAKGRNQLHITDFDDFVQTDAAINPGNSGGPLLNLEGQVIGINTAIVSGSGGYMGIGFAIPSSMATIIIDQLIDTGSVIRGFLGITMQQINGDLASFYKLDKPQGALVTDVVKGSPSDKAGLKPEDIIISYNGHPVENINSFRNAVALMTPGSKLNLEINRDGKLIMVHVTVGSVQDEQENGYSNQIGIEVQTLTPDLAQQLGYTGEKGVIISKVAPGSLAAEAGLKQGNVILAVNRNKITNSEEFKEAMQKATKEGRVLFMIRQGDSLRFVTFTLNG